MSLINLYYINNKSYNENDNMNNDIDIGNEVSNTVFLVVESPFNNLYQTKTKFNSNYQNVHDIEDKIIYFLEEISLNHSNRNFFKSKCYIYHTVNSNCNVRNKFSKKKINKMILKILDSQI